MKEYTFTEFNRHGEKVTEFVVKAKNYNEAIKKLNNLSEYNALNNYYYVIFTRVRVINK